MTAKSNWQSLFHSRSLKNHFLMLNAIIFLATAIPSILIFNQISDNILIAFGTRFAEKQVLYDRERNLLPLTRELALSRRLAASSQIVEWLKNESDQKLKQKAIKILENYADSFQDKSYFVGVSTSGHYYFNDEKGSFTGKEFRYTLNSEDPGDKWFFVTLESDNPYHLNVDYDDKLDVTKVWINVLVKDDRNRKLGLIGTGIDLTKFIHNFIDVNQQGVMSLLLDSTGTIQLHKNRQLIDLATITKLPSDKNSIFHLIDSEQDQQALKDSLLRLQGEPDSVETLFVNFNGERRLFGASYIDEIGWYSLTIMDVEEMVGDISFYSIAILLGGSLIVLMLLLTWLLHRLILRRIIQLDISAVQMIAGNYKAAPYYGPKDEIGRLSDHFKKMANQVLKHTEELEAKVLERTKALHLISITDPLTKLLNRRGINDRWKAKSNLANREQKSLGVLLIDIDFFKKIIDTYGHDFGDQALIEVSSVIQNTIRSYDDCARWGGEEFVVLIYDATDTTLSIIAEKIRQRVKQIRVLGSEEDNLLSISLGGYISKNIELIEDATNNADKALYTAKNGGRDRYQAYMELSSSGDENNMRGN